MEDYFGDDEECDYQENDWHHSDSKHYNEGLDMDQQSPEFWNDLERNADC